jgi:nitroimidazol reductase NimA-like FMN-containing flavoprotein (pyridoxamine 5'-phosphate oxidase superfamily)
VKTEMQIVKLPEMTEEEIEEALISEIFCRIAFIDGDYPYIVHFQYLYFDHKLYFHLTNYGKKMDILTKNRNVCVSIEKFESKMQSYYFI